METLTSLIKKIAEELTISESRYDSAERSYKSIGAWLNRAESKLKEYNVKVYLQGSFRLGIAIKPYDTDEHYDLDMVCEVEVSKSNYTQEQFQNIVGSELVEYAKSHGMEKPEKWDRCWTLNYSEEAKFHIDFLPSVPDGNEQIRIFNDQKLNPSEFTGLSIAITDRNHTNFKRYSTDWPISNPNGYSNWFKSKMFLKTERLENTLQKGKVDVSQMPAFKRNTTLQLAVKILKRHRDVMFFKNPSDKPSSIILTTLAASAYGGEDDLGPALLGILSRINNFILKNSDGTFKISNPSDIRENFADAWIADPKKSVFFFDWLETVTRDFEIALHAKDFNEMIDALAPRLGRKLVESRINLQKSTLLALPASSSVPDVIKDAPHKKPLKWPYLRSKLLNITKVTCIHNGVERRIQSNDLVENGSKIIFDATTNAAKPYTVFWQIVNTGAEAADAKNLRGNFDEDPMSQGTLRREENAMYVGTHSAQCFLVKDRKCIAKSPEFIVRVR